MYCDVDYTHGETEFEEMRRLLVASYTVNRKPRNWRLAMAENWSYASRYLEPLSYFTDRVHLWRNAGGELAGFLIRHWGLVWLQARDESLNLDAGMLDWAERHWAGDKACISTMIYDWDAERVELFSQRGYKNLGAIEDVRIYDLARSYPEPVLSPDFGITSVAEFGHHAERVELENRIWGISLDEAWFRGKSSAPSYSSEWDLIVVSPDGRPVAACLVWLYPQNNAAEIDPLGTHPAYRRLGLARALVLATFQRLRTQGIRYVYIASETENPIVSQLYTSLQPSEMYQGYHWRKQLGE